MTALWFARHGQSTWNAEGRWQGQADPPLSALGRVQAEALAEALAGAGIALLAASDLARARETAAIVGARLGLAPVLEPALREHDVGAWSGLTRTEVEARWPAELARFRARMPATPLLLPGYGAQGAKAADLKGSLGRDSLGAIYNSSRGIIFAYEKEPYKSQFGGDKWAKAVGAAAEAMKKEINAALA